LPDWRVEALIVQPGNYRWKPDTVRQGVCFEIVTVKYTVVKY